MFVNPSVPVSNRLNELSWRWIRIEYIFLRKWKIVSSWKIWEDRAMEKRTCRNAKYLRSENKRVENQCSSDNWNFPGNQCDSPQSRTSGLIKPDQLKTRPWRIISPPRDLIKETTRIYSHAFRINNWLAHWYRVGT